MDAEILVAEDESAIREGLCALLESEGYTVRAAVDGEDALRLFGECRPDLVLLDVMMPKKNGYAVCSEIRSSDQDVPILFLTAKDGDSDELRGLTLGADDYISKTSSQPVLLARIASVLNRVRRTGGSSTGDFDFADWHVDVARFRLESPAGESVELTLREIAILRYLASHPDEILSRDFLLTRFWGVNFDGKESTLSTAIRRLREKLGDAGVRIESVYGSGYRYRS
ncbi:MAG: response regulator transcription factor [Kiritimatiellia bacterium]